MIDTEEIERLMEARKKTWRRLHESIGADAAAQDFAKKCRADMDAACAEDEKANAALSRFLASQAEK